MSEARAGGFIKLHRRLESWPLWEAMPALQRMVWIQLLISANWRDREAWYGSRPYLVRRGQLALGEVEIAARAKVSRQVVRDTFARLISEGSVTRSKALPGNHAPWLTTVVNYERFQGEADSESPQKNHGRTTQEPSENQPRALREEREEGEEPSPHSPPSRWTDLRARLTPDQIATMEQQRAALVSVVEAQRLWPSEARARVQEIDDRLYVEWSSSAGLRLAAGGTS